MLSILIQKFRRPSVTLRGIVSKRFNITLYFIQYGSPIILGFPVRNIFAKFRQGNSNTLQGVELYR